MNILLKDKGSWIKVPIEQVIYISTTRQPHLLQVTTDTDDYFIYDSLHHIEKRSNKLMFCNKSVIVNIDQIERIEQKLSQIHFHSPGIPAVVCSRSRYKEILQAWKAL
ncbi:LytTR family transcriptional regulator DNA-binding domain-containing protein [Enterococcus sp. MJM12]|uniref:LytTR family transcriptional regulator DNA-binding domain-containing protein n=2 Tax=Candidatus Enterococcus myersii TaxID=2815322 RepID=A0ABS3H980_9ENTE|nr:LytTR family transcriptional regulator DNA-binding domain-containing protein [Enterococcus sp. MJM12]